MMADPTRIQLRRTKGWRMPPDTVKVDRTTKWGNPAIVVLDQMVGAGCEDDEGDEILQGPWLCSMRRGRRAGWWFSTKEQALEKAVAYFRYLVTESPGRIDWTPKIAELRGKNLACWCAPGASCHADVLLELANKSLPPTPIDRGDA